jgi:hypothetical protein
MLFIRTGRAPDFIEVGYNARLLHRATSLGRPPAPPRSVRYFQGDLPVP